MFFDLPGEYHFKSRFRPRFEPRYICHWPHASVRSMWSLVRLSGVLNLDYRKLATAAWSGVRRSRSRQLAAPPPQGE
jgi:phosphatidylglycerol lysyltransferase